MRLVHLLRLRLEALLRVPRLASILTSPLLAILAQTFLRPCSWTYSLVVKLVRTAFPNTIHPRNLVPQAPPVIQLTSPEFLRELTSLLLSRGAEMGASLREVVVGYWTFLARQADLISPST